MKNFTFFLLLASTSSFAQGYKSFFTSFDPSVHVSKDRVLTSIKEHFAGKGTYLALGETHLESESVHPLQKEFVDAFLEAKGQQNFTYCSETIQSWFDSEGGKKVEAQASEFKHFPGTGFNKCQSRTNDLYFTYAGNFHLFPYARGFAHEFRPNAVLDRDDLNMHAQMRGEKGLFIPQFELVYLEGQASASLFKEDLRVDQFRKKAKELLDQSQKIRSSMVEVLAGESPYANKQGIFLPKQSFASNVLMPKKEEFFFFLTNRTYRGMEYAHHFAQKILKLDDSKLARFLKKVKEKRSYFYSFFFTRPTTGEVSFTTFSGLPGQVDGESQLMDFGSVKIVSQPENSGLECFESTDEKITQVDCLETIESKI